MLDKDVFLEALKIKLPNANVRFSEGTAPLVNYVKRSRAVQLGRGALFRKGAAHADKFVAQRYLGGDYAGGYKEAEHPVVTITITGEAPKYSYCDAKYDGVDEWHYSKESALKAAWMSRSPLRTFMNNKYSFDGFINEDLRIKPDIHRYYQRSIDDGVSCSIDGKLWWPGGIMNCPLIPNVRVYSKYASIKNNEYRDGYVVIKATEELLVKGSLTKLKPEKPKEPELFYGPSWMDNHLKNSQCYWDGKCEHYIKAEEKFNSDIEKYQADLKKWLEL